MKTVLAVILIAFAGSGLSAGSFAAETGAAETPSSVVPGGEPTPPEAADDQEQDADQTEPDADIMQNFTRHRPGACPEGPPCKAED